MSIVLFTVIDLETTGLAPPASVIEIGVTRVYFETETKTAEIGPTEARLFAPKSLDELTPENIAVHHLTPQFLEGLEVATDDDLAEIVQRDRPQFLVAANCDFERQWITPEIAGKDLNGKAPFWVCTVKASAQIFPDAESHSNQATRYRLGLDLPDERAMPPHRAGPDSFVTAHILARFLQDGHRAAYMEMWTRAPKLMTRCPIGKEWRGKPWAEVDAGFLDWVLKQSDMDADIAHWARVELERRRAAA